MFNEYDKINIYIYILVIYSYLFHFIISKVKK